MGVFTRCEEHGEARTSVTISDSQTWAVQLLGKWENSTFWNATMSRIFFPHIFVLQVWLFFFNCKRQGPQKPSVTLGICNFGSIPLVLCITFWSLFRRLWNQHILYNKAYLQINKYHIYMRNRTVFSPPLIYLSTSRKCFMYFPCKYSLKCKTSCLVLALFKKKKNFKCRTTAWRRLRTHGLDSAVFHQGLCACLSYSQHFATKFSSN